MNNHTFTNVNMSKVDGGYIRTTTATTIEFYPDSSVYPESIPTEPILATMKSFQNSGDDVKPIEKDGSWIIQKTGWYRMTDEGPVLLDVKEFGDEH